MNLPELHGLRRRRWWREDRCLCGLDWPCAYLVYWSLLHTPVRAAARQPIYGLGMPAKA